jgi:hypothetical protein
MKVVRSPLGSPKAQDREAVVLGSPKSMAAVPQNVPSSSTDARSRSSDIEMTAFEDDTAPQPPRRGPSSALQSTVVSGWSGSAAGRGDRVDPLDTPVADSAPTPSETPGQQLSDRLSNSARGLFDSLLEALSPQSSFRDIVNSARSQSAGAPASESSQRPRFPLQPPSSETTDNQVHLELGDESSRTIPPPDDEPQQFV